MNELDSEIMRGTLERRGLERSLDEREADLLIYNTCSIRDLAERKVMGKIGKISRSKKNRIIGLAGCMANAKKENLFKKLPHLDFILGPNNIHDLDNVLDELLDEKRHIAYTSPQLKDEPDYLAANRESKVKAYVSIIRGCNKFCTYCIVPYVRGQEVSRSPESILEECELLAEKGYKEITLLGQNVNSYGKDKPAWGKRFHDLLYSLDKIDGIERIRFMTSHPVDITRELMEAVRDLPSLCEFVHFPIQSGSDRILKKMHRMYSVEQYLEKVSMLREIVPNVCLGTDIIVGFPSETEEEFEMTYRLMEKIKYSLSFLFTYSPRKGTPAMRWKDDVPEKEKEERLQRLMSLQEGILAQDRQNMLSTEAEALIERSSSKDEGALVGKTRCWKNIICPGDKSLIGSIQKVRIHSYSCQTLIGEIV